MIPQSLQSVRSFELFPDLQAALLFYFTRDSYGHSLQWVPPSIFPKVEPKLQPLFVVF